MRYAGILGVTMTALGFSFDGNTALAEAVAVVSPKSSITTLTRNQVADIFLGKTGHFPDGTPVLPIDQAEGSTVRDEFYSAMAGKSPSQIKAYWSKIIFTGRGMPPRAAENSAEAKKLLGANPNVITYIDKSAVDANVKVLQIAP